MNLDAGDLAEGDSDDGSDDDEEDDENEKMDVGMVQTERNPMPTGGSITDLRDKLHRRIADLRAGRRGRINDPPVDAGYGARAGVAPVPGDAPTEGDDSGGEGSVASSRDDLLDERRKKRGEMRDKRRRERKEIRRAPAVEAERKKEEAAKAKKNGKDGKGEAKPAKGNTKVSFHCLSHLMGLTDRCVLCSPPRCSSRTHLAPPSSPLPTLPLPHLTVDPSPSPQSPSLHSTPLLRLASPSLRCHRIPRLLCSFWKLGKRSARP